MNQSDVYIESEKLLMSCFLCYKTVEKIRDLHVLINGNLLEYLRLLWVKNGSKKLSVFLHCDIFFTSKFNVKFLKIILNFDKMYFIFLNGKCAYFMFLYSIIIFLFGIFYKVCLNAPVTLQFQNRIYDSKNMIYANILCSR